MKRAIFALGLALIAAGAFGWSTLHPRVQSGTNEYWIDGGRLVANGAPTHTEALLVGICEDGSVWVLQRIPYQPRFRWGRVERAIFYEDPLMNGRPTINWRASRLPEC